MDRDAIFNNSELMVDVQPDPTPIRGNVSAINDQIDEQNENKVLEQLAQGNYYAWCIVMVKLIYIDADDITYIGSDHIGTCSFASKNDLYNSDLYFDLKEQAFEQLLTNIKAETEMNDLEVRSSF